MTCARIGTSSKRNNRVGSVGLTPRALKNMTNNRKVIAIYDGLVNNLTSYVNNKPAVCVPDGFQAPRCCTEGEASLRKTICSLA
jgi:hypothetical protein